MRIFKIILCVLMGLVLVAVAAVAALIFVDPTAYRNQIETRASAAFGREFKIAGPIHLERSLRPRIIVEDISIGNPDWATGTHFATAEKFGLQVALFPLLRGNIRILDVSFSGVDLFIEKGPGGANNYTFGRGDESETTGSLPAVDRLQVNDSVINYKTADGSSKEMTFTIRLTADSAAELSGPQNPWSLKLDIEGPDMSLALAGTMDEAFKWEQGDYLIKLSGDQADSLETLFDVEWPTSGPFELSANVNKTDRFLRVTDIAARLQGTPQTPAIIISHGEASGGQDDPLQLALQGQFGEAPFTLRFESTLPIEDISQKTPWPIEAQLNLADLKLNIESEMIPATVAEYLEFNAQVQGETLNTLSRLLDTDFPETGPYRLSFHTRISAGNYAVSELEGAIESLGHWQKLRVDRGNASLNQNGSIEASLEGKVDNLPSSLSLKGGPERPAKAGQKTWPLIIDASASGATIKGEGAVVTIENKKVLQIATHVSGNRFESLGPLIGVSFPAMGKFDLHADISSDGDVHEAGNLRVQIKNNRFSGSVRWEGKAPRPILSGRLSIERLRLSDFEVSSKNAPKSRRTGLLDRPIKLDALSALDARLEFTVKSVADSPMPVADIRSTVTLTNGELSAPFRTNLAGVPVDGQIQLRRRNNASTVSFNATAKKIDVGQTLKQLKMTEMVTGTTDALELKASSAGKTLRALLEQAAFALKLKPADMSYSLKIGSRTLDFTFSGVELTTRKGEPLAAVFEGMFNGTPFNGDVSTANLVEIQKANALLPLRVTIKKADLIFKAEGTIEQPFKRNSFGLQYELTGKEIQGLAPLADFAMPLRGEFSARGRITGRGNRFTYTEDLRVGKSELKANIMIVRGSPRPKISGNITASQIHLDDVQLVDADEEAATTEDRPPRVIPDYTLPVDELLAVDLDMDFRAERIRASLGDLGEFVMKISLKNGRFKSSTSVTGFKGERISSEFDLNAASQPPASKLRINAKDLNFGYLLSSIDVTDIIEGNVNLQVDLSGTGATRYDFLGNAEGRITIIGGPGRMKGRRIDLWAADLIPTMLSTQWQRKNVTETNCLVAHIELGEGQAKIEDLLLDTQRITIAASGILNLETEELDLIVAPRPKRASLVSLANPVRIKGTLAKPEVSVTRIPRGRRLAAAGLLAGLVNPAFLIFALGDIGTGRANPCDAAVERAREISGIDSE
jgi:uncharacterized protein involved in outer membrane biogenesis